MKDQRDIVGLSSNDGSRSLEVSGDEKLESNLVLAGAPPGLGDGSTIAGSGTDGGCVSLDSSARNNNERALNVVDVEFELGLLVGGVQGGGNRTLGGDSKEGDNEFEVVGESDRDS